MFIKYEKKKDKDGNLKTWIVVVEGYKDVHNVARHRRVKNYGYLEKQKNKEEYIEMIKKEIPLFEQSLSNKVTVEYDTTDKNHSVHNIPYNFGFVFLEKIYDSLGLNELFNDHQKKLSKPISYDLSSIFKYYTLLRILSPNSKRATLKCKECFMSSSFDFDLNNTYSSLDYIALLNEDIQQTISSKMDNLIKKDTSKIYYDATNYFTEIDFNDTDSNYRHKGVSKEHRLSPIVGFGLFLDSNGLPLKFSVYNGYEAESTKFIPQIEILKSKYGLNKVIVVADKGMNSIKNQDILLDSGNGYMFSQIIQGPKGSKYASKIIDPNIVWNGKTGTYGELVYKEYKYIEDYDVITYEEDKENPGKQKKVVTSKERNVLIYWNKSDDDRAKKKREEDINASGKSLENNAYSIKKDICVLFKML
ncbi:MAG: hypothetical protein LBV51_01020 [Acholeplasmatales bacterium]|jgi:transposase|nr:hypothetical protein [Acholeplasmatales bacterium]